MEFFLSFFLSFFQETFIIIIIYSSKNLFSSPDSWVSCCSRNGKIPPPNNVLHTTQNTLMVKLLRLEIWRMWNTLSISLLPWPLFPGVVAPDSVRSIGGIEQILCKKWTTKDKKNVFHRYLKCNPTKSGHKKSISI